ncbi:hypothetical protein HYC85_031726 [Camellia sinensis]|uniref:Scarecrow-like protein 14 n=1 Tax=Camellia sinensis TaxID=4442 RepID=A0A7J7FR99_CAMSI|nr:hypothetical protein HYC85_031726 [Camellia sinensis]
MNGFKFNHNTISSFSQRNFVNHEFGIIPNVPNPSNIAQSSDPDSPEDENTILKYISQMLMEEEDLEHKPCMFQDCMALQAAEKSFYDVLGEKYPPSSIENQHPLSLLNQNPDSPIDNFTGNCSSQSCNSSVTVDNFIESAWFRDRDKFERSFTQSSHEWRGNSPNGSRGKKNHDREESDCVESGRSNKQLAASSMDESDEEPEMYDKVLLCPGLNPHLHEDSASCVDDNYVDHNVVARGKLPRGSNGGGRPRGKKQGGNKKEVVDLMSLLTQCAQAIASSDSRTANELLNRIRQYASAYGDGTERLAYYFAKALEARLAGAGTMLYTAFVSTGISAADILKGYQVYIKACPFKKLSNFYANRSIMKLSKKATRLHIIDFGILYGFQWPSLIQRLSMREGGPPKLHITGIELPQPGFRPAERVEETGRRLAKDCKRFNVPFEFNAIAKKWDTIQLEDIKIEADEVLVVNCLYRLKNVPDDTVAVSSPRDMVLNLIKRINPDLFVHGVLNGMFNAPFFATRFREALFHFSALFDMYDANVPREDHYRMLFEKETYGRDRVRVLKELRDQETYKQWQVRNIRAGFRQLPLDKEIVGEVRRKVRQGYNKDFVVDEDSNWMLQGWKGRIIYAISAVFFSIDPLSENEMKCSLPIPNG